MKRGLASLLQVQLRTGKAVEVNGAKETPIPFIHVFGILLYAANVTNLMCGNRMTCLEGAQSSTKQPKVK